MRRNESDRLLRSVLVEKFVVTLDDGTAFEGLLVDVDERTVLLDKAWQFQTDGSKAPVDGRLFLPRNRVLYVQHA